MRFAGATKAIHLCLAAFIFILGIAAAAPAQAQIAKPIPNGNWWRNCASLDLDFYNDRYYINKNTTCDGTTGTKYSGAAYGTNVTNFITGTGATFTRAGSNVTSAAAPFYLSSIQSFISRATVANNVTSALAPFYTNASQSWVSRADSGAVATYFDSTGTLQTAAAGTTRNAAYYYSGGTWVTASPNILTPQTISGITDASGTATVTTSAAHGLVVGNIVTLSGNYPSNYNGAFTIVSVPSSTTFTYTMTSDPGVNASQIGNYTALATTPAVLIEPASTNSIRNNTMAGAVVADNVERSNNGTFSTTAPNVCSGSDTASANNLSCSNGTAITAQTISSITYSGKTATLTTGAAHGLAAGNIVTISGVTGTSATSFNGTFMVVSITSTTKFTYTMVTTPSAAATVTGASYTATTGGWAGTVNGGTGTVTGASGSMTLTGDGTNYAAAYQAITTVIGNVYVFSVTVGSSNTVMVQAGTTIGGATLQAATTASASATSLYEFKATSTTTYIQIKNISTTAAAVSAVSFQSAGVFPTNWTWSQNDSGTALYIYALGTQNGMPYIDFQILGTAQNGYPSTVAADSSTTAIVGQPWTSSVYTMKVSGTSTIGFYMCYYATVNAGCPAGTTVGTHTNITSSRIYSTITPSNATLTSIYDYMSWATSIGVAANAVFRIGLAQREQSSTVTTPIETSGSTVTRPADVYSQQPASYFDNTGTLNFAVANTARDNHNPTSPYADLGTLIEPAATNSIRNNMMVGAVASDTIERVNNGTFSNTSPSSCSGSVTSSTNTLSCNNGGGTGWVGTINSGTGTITASTGSMSLTGDGTNAASIYQAVPTISGYRYTIAVTTAAGNAVTVQAGTSTGGTNLLAASTAAASTTTNYQFTATSTPTYIQINNVSATAANVSIVSIQSAGRVPTNFSPSTQNGIIAKIVGTGTENGINYVDVQYSGTATALASNTMTFETCNGIAASQNQAWSFSPYFKITAGSLSNINQITIKYNEDDSSCTLLAQDAVGFGSLPTGSNLGTQRYSYTLTTTNSSIAYVQPSLLLQWASGQTANVTLRVGMPQMERNSYGTSPIPTFGSTVTRSADVYNQPVGTYFNGSGVLTTAANNTPRMDHSPTGNYAPQGVLIEEARTNLITYSSYFTSPWTNNTSDTITNNAATAPDNTGTAILFQEGTGATTHSMYDVIAGTANTTYTFSVYVKSYSGDRNIGVGFYDTTDGNFGELLAYNPSTNQVVATSTGASDITGAAYTTQALSNGWSRISISGAPTVASFQVKIYDETGTSTNFTGNNSSGIYVWGAQLEAGAFPTSYIPTSGTTITRNADLFTLPTAASGTNGAWYSQGVGTVGFNATLPYTGATLSTSPARYFSLDDGTTSNSIQTIFNYTSVLNTNAIQTSGSVIYQANSSAAAGTVKGDIAFSSSGTTNSALNGVALGAATITPPSGITELQIGGAYGARQLNGWLRRIWYQPVRDGDNSLPDYSKVN